MILSIIPLYFFPCSYKCGIVYTLAYRYPRVCYDWTRFHVDLTLVSTKRSHILKQTCSCSSRPEVFCTKSVLRNFAKFLGKHLCQSLQHRCFPVNFVKFVRTSFFPRTPPVDAFEVFTCEIYDYFPNSFRMEHLCACCY